MGNPPDKTNELDDSLREKLAAIEHERWADWQKWVHQSTHKGSQGEITFNSYDQFMEWERQINTPYADLSDREKASDMEQVDRYWPLIQACEAEAYRRGQLEGLDKATEVENSGMNAKDRIEWLLKVRAALQQPNKEKEG